MTAVPPKADVHPRSCHVANVPFSGFMHRNKQNPYSITWSASVSSVGTISRPRAFSARNNNIAEIDEIRGEPAGRGGRLRSGHERQLGIADRWKSMLRPERVMVAEDRDLRQNADAETGGDRSLDAGQARASSRNASARRAHPRRSDRTARRSRAPRKRASWTNVRGSKPSAQSKRKGDSTDGLRTAVCRRDRGRGSDAKLSGQSVFLAVDFTEGAQPVLRNEPEPESESGLSQP
jgi:hypothetical protein